MTKSLAILGSTGSIGTQCLDICRNMGYHVSALTTNRNIELLAEQAREFNPGMIAVADSSLYSALKLMMADTNVTVMAGSEAVSKIAAMDGADTVVNSLTGIAGLRPTIASLDAGKKVALANKEALVTGGELVMRDKDALGRDIFPIDSEHSAIWQCLRSGERDDVRKIILTASGGPFFLLNRSRLAHVTVEQALRHPNWSMGAKITIDSATLMNKGLEFIEAMRLFSLEPEDIEVIVHRQSVLHSAVEFADGSVIAQMGVPDMRCAIQYALTYPRHIPMNGKRLSLIDYGCLTFEKPDADTFCCLSACIKAAKLGGLSPCVANGANEKAVELFLEGRISFLSIGDIVMDAVETIKPSCDLSLEAIEQADLQAREFVMSKIGI